MKDKYFSEMDTLYPDLIHKISEHLNNQDLLSLLMVNKKLHQNMDLYYKRKIFNYDHPHLNKKRVQQLMIHCTSVVHHRQSWMKKLFQSLLFWKKNKPYYRYTIMVQPVSIQISDFISLKKLVLDDFFNQELDFEFPPHLKHIVFGKRFQKKIDNLPETIQKIEFHHLSLWDQEIERFPNQLKEIIFGRFFQRTIDHLPDSVERIEMKYCSYSEIVVKKLPKNLKYLAICDKIKIECEIPNHVTFFSNY